MTYVKYVIPFLFFCSSLSAATADWNLDNNGNWNTNANWTPATFPNAIDDVAQLLNAITANRAITLGQDIIVGTLNIDNANNYTVQSNTLTFQTSAGNAQINITNGNGNGTHTIASAVILNSPLTLSQGSTGNFSITGVISGSQPLTKTGTNTLIYGGPGANTYTGLTSINGGTLQLSKVGVNALAGDATISAGGTLLFGQIGQVSSASTVTLAGGTLNLNALAGSMGHLDYQSGTLTFGGGGTLTLASNATALTLSSGIPIVGPLIFSGSGAIVALNGAQAINGTKDLGGFTHDFFITGIADSLNLVGIISNGGVHMKGPGVLEMTGGASNTYTGLTTLSGGILRLNKTVPSISIPGDVMINGGTLFMALSDQIAPASTVTINGGTFDLNNQSLTIDHLIYNGGAINNIFLPLTLQDSATALTMRNTTLDGAGLLLSNSGSVVFDPTNNGTGTIISPIDLGAGTVIFDIGNGTNAIDMDIQGTISNGGVTKVGAGHLAFTGIFFNTYTGTTTVSSGILSLNKTGVTIAISGPVVINGGTLLLNAQEQIQNAQTMTITGGNFAMNGFTETLDTLNFFGGSVTQSGGLLRIDTALTMRNTALNGPIRLNGGAAITFDATNSGTATINGTLNLSGLTSPFNIANGSAASDMVIGSVISNGGINKTGLGTLVLLGANTYAGGTTVTAGTLQGTTTSLQGGMTNNSTLVFDQDFDGNTSGTLLLSGTGDLIKNGSGTVRFVSPQLMNGPTTVAEGTLLINSSFGPVASLLNVNLGGILGGTGTINKDVTVSGTLAPGDNGIGTLTLNGVQTMATGSTLEIDLTPTSNDFVNVGGTFTIQSGSIFSFTPEPNNYVSPLFYTVVQTTGGVSGTFDNALDPFPLFQGQLSYTANDVVLQLILPPISSLPGLSLNAAKVAQCLDGKNPAPGSDLYDVINSLRFLSSVESIEKALLRMEPSIFSSLAMVKESSTLNFRHTFFNRLETRGRSCSEDEKGYHYWGTPIVGFAKEKTHGKKIGYDAFSPGVAIGIDGFVFPKFQLGGSIAYTHSDINWNSDRGEAGIHSVYGAIYGRYGSSVGYLDGALILGYDHYSTTRKIWFGGLLPLNRRAKGSHNGFESSFHLKGGCHLPVNGTHLGPYASFDFFYIYEGSFTENGANSLNLDIKSKHPMLLQSEMGLDFSHCINLRRQTLIPFMHVSGIWEKRFNGEKQCAHFGKCLLDVRGYYPSRVLVGTGGGFIIEWEKKFAPKVSFSYKGKYGRGYQDQSLNFELIY